MIEVKSERWCEVEAATMCVERKCEWALSGGSRKARPHESLFWLVDITSYDGPSCSRYKYHYILLPYRAHVRHLTHMHAHTHAQ